MSDKFEPGSVVCLKSNPEQQMVVVGKSDGKVTCEWINRNGDPQKFGWSPSALSPAGQVAKIERVIVGATSSKPKGD